MLTEMATLIIGLKEGKCQVCCQDLHDPLLLEKELVVINNAREGIFYWQQFLQNVQFPLAQEKYSCNINSPEEIPSTHKG